MNYREKEDKRQSRLTIFSWMLALGSAMLGKTFRRQVFMLACLYRIALIVTGRMVRVDGGEVC